MRENFNPFAYVFWMSFLSWTWIGLSSFYVLYLGYECQQAIKIKIMSVLLPLSLVPFLSFLKHDNKNIQVGGCQDSARDAPRQFTLPRKSRLRGRFFTNFVSTAAAVRNCSSPETSLKMTEIFIVELATGGWAGGLWLQLLYDLLQFSKSFGPRGYGFGGGAGVLSTENGAGGAVRSSVTPASPPSGRRCQWFSLVPWFKNEDGTGRRRRRDQKISRG